MYNLIIKIWPLSGLGMKDILVFFYLSTPTLQNKTIRADVGLDKELEHIKAKLLP